MVGTLLRYGYLETRGEALRVEDVRSAWGRVLRVICKDGSWLKMRYSTFERSEYELALFVKEAKRCTSEARERPRK